MRIRYSLLIKTTMHSSLVLFYFILFCSIIFRISFALYIKVRSGWTPTKRKGNIIGAHKNHYLINKEINWWALIDGEIRATVTMMKYKMGPFLYYKYDYVRQIFDHLIWNLISKLENLVAIIRYFYS